MTGQSRQTDVMAQTAPTVSDLAAAAVALKPALAAQAEDAERARDLPAATVALLKDAGFHRLYMPRRFGGYEMDWGAHFAVSREVGEACGACAWMTSLVFSHIMWVGRFGAAAQEEFFARSPDPILGTGSAGGGLLVPVDGGFRLTGRWGFVSGISHAGGAMVVAKTEADKLFSHFVLLLPGEYEIEDTWDAEGLRGTGSHHIRVKDQFVPARRAAPRDAFLSTEPPGAKLHNSYVYRLRPAPYQKSWFAGPLIGTARGALASYLTQTKERVGQLFGESIAGQEPVQIRIGETIAEIEAATLMFENFLNVLHERGAAGAEIRGEDLLRAKRTMALGARLCLQATTRLSGMMGVTGQTAKNPVQRLFRDCRTISTHIELNWDHSMTPSGKFALGLKTGDPMIDGGAPTTGAATRAMLGTQV